MNHHCHYCCCCCSCDVAAVAVAVAIAVAAVAVVVAIAVVVAVVAFLRTAYHNDTTGKMSINNSINMVELQATNQKGNYQ